MGYTVVKIHEVWHFPASRRRKDLFANCVNQWLKIKQESGGYSAWAQTDLQKQQYVRQYKKREGIALTPVLIGKNPGRKAMAKLLLNSSLGQVWRTTKQTKNSYHHITSRIVHSCKQQPN